MDYEKRYSDPYSFNPCSLQLRGTRRRRLRRAKRLEEQNSLMRELLDEYKKGPDTDAARPTGLPPDKVPVPKVSAADASETDVRKISR